MRVTKQTQGPSGRRGPKLVVVDDHAPRFRVHRPAGLEPSIEFVLFSREADGSRCTWSTVEMTLGEARGMLMVLLEFVGSYSHEREQRLAAERRADELQRRLDALTGTPTLDAAEPQAGAA